MNPSVAMVAMLLVSCHAFVHRGLEADMPLEIEEYDAQAEGNLVSVLEKLKTVLRKGNATIGIPVLDPFQKDELQLNLNKPETIELAATLQNVRAYGLSMYEVEQGEFSIVGFKVQVGLLWNNIALMTNYKMDGKLAGLADIYGEGKIAAALKGLKVLVNATLGYRDKKLYVKELHLEVHLKEIDFQITGLLNDEDLSKLFSVAVTEMLPQLIDDYQKQLTDYADPLLAKMFDKVLSHFSLQDLMGMMGSK